MKNLLFLGDSITDCGHCFTPDNLGDGYVRLIATQINNTADGASPSYTVINGGTDGFTFPSIYRKWQRSYAARTYDIVSILGGINDIGAVMDSGMSESQVQAQLLNSELALKSLLADLVKQHTPLILLPEPFLFPYPHYLSAWMGRLEQMRAMIRAAACSPVFKKDASEIRIIPLQPVLDRCAVRCGFAAVTTDGIHLTPEGHRIVCGRVLEELKDHLPTVQSSD